MATNAFQPAAGGASRGETHLTGMSKQYSARDMPANKTLKYREKGQSTQEELRLKDREGLRRELEERERNVRDKSSSSRPSSDLKRITSGGTISSSSSRSKPSSTHTETNIDADDPLDESSSDEDDNVKKTRYATKNPNENAARMNAEEDDDDDDDDDDDEDDTAELMAELARIKKERAAESARLEQQKRVEEEKIRTENILRGNPLLNPSARATTTEYRVKRRWDDDVVFKNCAKADSSSEKRGPQFVNDSLRSEFHRRFMDKYIK